MKTNKKTNRRGHREIILLKKKKHRVHRDNPLSANRSTLSAKPNPTTKEREKTNYTNNKYSLFFSGRVKGKF
jgi:hypothetical protein